MRALVTWSVGLIVLLVAALAASYLARIYSDHSLPSPERVSRGLRDLQQPWAEELVHAWSGYRGWLNRHGTQTEVVLFDDISTMVIESAAHSNAASTPPEELGAFGKIFLSLHTGVIQLLFLFFASLRLWLVVLGFSFYAGFTSYRPYTEEDALGQMGNGRLFYSGVRAGLEKLTANGAPDVQVRGFACPQMATSAEAHASPLWRTLSEYNACNSTNEALIRAIVRNGGVAPYVPPSEEEALLAKSYAGGGLEKNATYILRAALAVHRGYAEGDLMGERIPQGDLLNASPQDSKQYAERIQGALHRVLSPAMRREIARIPVAEIATAVLALESGKILAHSHEGGRWVRRSNFPHLSARAVLHSMIEYPKDYSFESRNRIRRALIYAARKSAFAPVRMPTDMLDDCWVVRQWLEVLLACPYELSAVADEVELVGLVRESHIAWCHEFFESERVLSSQCTENFFSTPTELLFLPVSSVVEIMRRVITRPTMDRMHTLLDRVGTQQRLQGLHTTESDTGPTEQLSFDRVVPLPPRSEIEALAALHGMSAHDLHDWLALRVVLSAYGWLASRVGDYSVPTTSIIFAVFRADRPLPHMNGLGLLGRPGMVPVRGSKLIDRWGRNWSARFTYVRKATMAEAQEDYEKLLKGIEDVEPLDEESATHSSTVVS
jgi:hypothetical protein